MANPDNNKMIEQKVAGIMQDFGFSTEEPTPTEARVKIILKDLLMFRSSSALCLQKMRDRADAANDLDDRSKRRRWSEMQKLEVGIAKINIAVDAVSLVFDPKRTILDLGDTIYHFDFPGSNLVEAERDAELRLLHSPRKFIDGLLQKLPRLGEQK